MPSDFMLKQRILDYLRIIAGPSNFRIAEALGEPPAYVDTTAIPGRSIPIGVQTARVDEALRELAREGKVEQLGSMWWLKKG